MKKLGVLIIGTGAISDEHIEACLKLQEEVEIKALSNRHTDVAAEKAERYGLKADISDDYTAFLGRKDIDIVSICTPPDTHCRIASDCLKAQKHVLLEKPMALSVEECDRLLNLQKKTGKLLSVIAQSRFNNDVMRIKSLLNDPECGKLLYAEADSVWWRGGCYYDLAWRGRWETEGGGCTLNHAVHHIDLLLWMAGKPKSVLAYMANKSHPNSEEEDLAMAFIEFENGALGRLTSSLVHHGQRQRLVFETEGAELAFPFNIECARSMPNGFPEKNIELEKYLHEKAGSLPPLKWTGHTGQWANMLAAVRGEEKLVVTGEDGKNALELIDAVYESATLNKKIEFPMNAENLFYKHEDIVKNAIRFSKKTVFSDKAYAGRMVLANNDYRQTSGAGF